MTKGKPGATKGGWLRAVENMETDVKVMQISIKTFYRFKNYSNRYCDADCYDDVLNELIDTAEQHKTNC